MKMIPVESSNIKAVGYDPSTRECRVRFHNGAEHVHMDIPPEKHSGFMTAESHGKYYNEHIKGGASKKMVQAIAPMRDEPQGSPPLHGDPDAALHAAARRFRQES
jgi:hypothetical protein